MQPARYTHTTCLLSILRQQLRQSHLFPEYHQGKLSGRESTHALGHPALPRQRGLAIIGLCRRLPHHRPKLKLSCHASPLRCLNPRAQPGQRQHLSPSSNQSLQDTTLPIHLTRSIRPLLLNTDELRRRASHTPNNVRSESFVQSTPLGRFVKGNP